MTVPSRWSARKRMILSGVGATIVSTLLLTGCSSNDSLSRQYGNGTTKNYISGDGTVTEDKPANRKAPIQFTATTDGGTTLRRSSFTGQVVVLNFWYASCPPCRLEAPTLESLSRKYAPQRVQFIGVNVRDEVATSKAFARSFGITYPSIPDAATATVQLALAGQRGPNATPTTMILDRQGRVAARILGGVNKNLLDTLISDTVAEGR